MLITPEYVFKDVTHITPEWLAQKGIRALVLDLSLIHILRHRRHHGRACPRYP